MEQGFIDILQKLIAEQGKETLLNASKCKAFLADYTKNEYKKESRLLLQALDAGVQKAIDASQELPICKKQQIRLLHEDYGLDAKIAADVVNALALVLRGDTARTEIQGADSERKQSSAVTSAPRASEEVHGTAVESRENGSVISSPFGYEMVHVPGGSFQMGDTVGGGYSGETPVHTVTLSDFYIGKYEVTQALYQSVTGDNPSVLFKGGNLPVVSVSWYDAIEFCNKLSEREGLTPAYMGSGTGVTWNRNATGYRLPTEAEWEYAAKGGNGSPENYKYAGSNDVNGVAWYKDNSGRTTHAVGTKAPNGLGIYDMSGNVWEWCWDWYGNYSSGAQTNPTGASSPDSSAFSNSLLYLRRLLESNRVSRGGSWDSSAENVRSASRGNYYPSSRYGFIGFRLVRP